MARNNRAHRDEFQAIDLNPQYKYAHMYQFTHNNRRHRCLHVATLADGTRVVSLCWDLQTKELIVRKAHDYIDIAADADPPQYDPDADHIWVDDELTTFTLLRHNRQGGEPDPYIAEIISCENQKPYLELYHTVSWWKYYNGQSLDRFMDFYDCPLPLTLAARLTHQLLKTVDYISNFSDPPHRELGIVHNDHLRDEDIYLEFADLWDDRPRNWDHELPNFFLADFGMSQEVTNPDSQPPANHIRTRGDRQSLTSEGTQFYLLDIPYIVMTVKRFLLHNYEGTPGAWTPGGVVDQNDPERWHAVNLSGDHLGNVLRQVVDLRDKLRKRANRHYRSQQPPRRWRRDLPTKEDMQILIDGAKRAEEYYWQYEEYRFASFVPRIEAMERGLRRPKLYDTAEEALHAGNVEDFPGPWYLVKVNPQTYQIVSRVDLYNPQGGPHHINDGHPEPPRRP
jgi:hypothetical protein